MSDPLDFIQCFIHLGYMIISSIENIQWKEFVEAS